MAAFSSIAIGAALATTALSTGFGVMQSVSQASSGEAFSKFNAGQAELRADQTDAQAREGMNFEIGEIITARAANGLDASSPTGRAIVADARRIRGRERDIAVGNERMQATQFRQQARQFAATRRGSLLGGGLKLLSTGAQAFSLFSGGFAPRSSPMPLRRPA